MASKRSWSLKGFVRNSTAPACIACTVVGMSPRPVIKITGISMSTSAIRFCRSIPLSPGRCTSNTRQLGAFARGPAKNCCAEANVSTLSPADRIKPSKDSRTDSSSSTTKTIASGSVITPLLVFQECELKGRAGTVIRGGPQLPAVILHDGATDRQPHSHPLRLGRVESVEDLFEVLPVKPDAGVLHGDERFVRFIWTRADEQLSRPARRRSHRLDTVHHEIENDLLQLHSVTKHGRQIGGQIHAQRHTFSGRFIPRQLDDLSNGLVDVQPRLLRIGFPQERSNPGDDLARPIPIADDAPGGFASLIEVGRGAVQPSQAGAAFIHVGRERLVDFVGY